jgi:hypothetical protein
MHGFGKPSATRTSFRLDFGEFRVLPTEFHATPPILRTTAALSLG